MGGDQETADQEDRFLEEDMRSAAPRGSPGILDIVKRGLEVDRGAWAPAVLQGTAVFTREDVSSRSVSYGGSSPCGTSQLETKRL